MGRRKRSSRHGSRASEASLYEHCARALDVSLSLGAHGLPLMGTGDWNDGMNRVGEKGRGESVWMGWFLLATIAAFAPYAQARNESGRVSRWMQFAAALRVALESAGLGRRVVSARLITMTAHRWVRAKTANAGSTRSHSRGASSRKRRTRSVPRWR